MDTTTHADREDRTAETRTDNQPEPTETVSPPAAKDSPAPAVSFEKLSGFMAS
jgi:hypothetical protein